MIFDINNPFCREIKESQSKYKIVKKDITQQSSYNLSLDLENYLLSKNVLKKVEAKSDDNNIYYELVDDVKLKLSKNIIDIIGPLYDNLENRIYFDHTISGATEKFQIKRKDHNINDGRYEWFKELYDKNCEGALFKIYYDENNRMLMLDNDLRLKITIEDIEQDSSDEFQTEDLTILGRFRKYYLENINSFIEDKELNNRIQLRKEFNEEYPLERIKLLNLDEYALGTPNFQNTLSYKLEFGKYKLAGASIGGGTSAKHGIYLRQDGNYYGRKNELINDPENFWIDFRNQLYNYLDEINNSDSMIDISEKYPILESIPAVLTKLSFLYYPYKFINFCAKDRLVFIMKKFDINFDQNLISPELSFILAKFLKEKIPEANQNDPQFLGDALWKFIDLLKSEEGEDEMNMEYEKYSKEDFLNEVFIDEEKYDSIVSILDKKKNIILEGAPGVGKTFMAKRLAYSILGNKDKRKVKLIQFHQSYSYEDFIEGYRPTEQGFELKKGLFYKICKTASEDLNNNYYIIIDEINRGNLSKIFGELLMLIESDKRGEKLTLAYSEEDFYVPSNLYIIGLMNTADRSLALIDYALRRRFSFIRIEPAFDSEKFRKEFNDKFDNNFDNVIEIIKKINEAIEDDKSLGKGFKIGHSYFCPNLIDRKGNKKDIQDIIKYEIVPLLEEYWYDDEDSLIQWENALNGVIND